ncbi:CLUMA_CG008155, isoform A [Clunio marinus]|uniref:CLUMA_CG008155, isoform A n=1 Tax=Clunio marinus TaxID=568069 RepID=A0A1J1I2T0_9DIPT|nr:CLUMA_CG008155, isoform A [Clunio marinus]
MFETKMFSISQPPNAICLQIEGILRIKINEAHNGFQSLHTYEVQFRISFRVMISDIYLFSTISTRINIKLSYIYDCVCKMFYESLHQNLPKRCFVRFVIDVMTV